MDRSSILRTSTMNVTSPLMRAFSFWKQEKGAEAPFLPNLCALQLLDSCGSIRRRFGSSLLSSHLRLGLSRKLGLTLSLLTALCMPVMLAHRMLRRSISSALTSSTAQAIASCSIMGRRMSRERSVIFLESFRSG